MIRNSASHRYLGAISGNTFSHPKAAAISGHAVVCIRRVLDAIVCELTTDPVRENQSRDAFIAEVIGQTADKQSY